LNGAYVVDASVVVKWYLTEEKAADKAASLYDPFYAGQVSLYAPALIIHEVPRSFHRAVRQHRINLDTALEYVSRFSRIQLTIVDPPETLSGAMRIAEEYRCNYYDACYLALADLLGLPFVFADDKLERQLAGRIAYALPLSLLDLR
jgi:predicted nucleic acid-binding protein